MKKKFLVVLLALTMVFAFSAAALAADPETVPAGTTTITLEVGNDNDVVLDSRQTATAYPTDGTTISEITATVVDKNDADGVINATVDITTGTITKGYNQIKGTVTYTIAASEGTSTEYQIPFTLDVYNGSSDASLKSITLASPKGGDAKEKIDISGTTASCHVDQDVSEVAVRLQ